MEVPIIAVVMTLLLTAQAVPALAGDKAPLITKRQERQRDLIHEGARFGQLTGDEADALLARQRAIKARRRAMAADGKLDKSERTLLRYEQQAAKRAIRREMSDAERAP